tara:strand:- start:155 stop:544 length:390 start_codon:yes stop_codon:yes gene_type:complete
MNKIILKLKELCGPIQLVLIFYLIIYLCILYILISNDRDSSIYRNLIGKRIYKEYQDEEKEEQKYLNMKKKYYFWDILSLIIWISILYFLCKYNYKIIAWIVSLWVLFIELMFHFVATTQPPFLISLMN